MNKCKHCHTIRGRKSKGGYVYIVICPGCFAKGLR